MNTLRSSGYTTVMLWCIHVDSASGNLIYNDVLVATNGLYVGNAAWPSQLATLKTAPTSVNRIEISVSSWGVNDFQSIKTLMDAYGTNTDSILYRNFLALKNATGADAVDFDDETQYDVNTAVKFGQMLSSMGLKVTLCPYTNPNNFWPNVYNQLGAGIVDRVYLQCYSGGGGNNPATWNGYFGGLKVIPGMWGIAVDSSGSTAAQVEAQMTAWRASAGITGGFIWLYDNIASNPGAGGSPADYAAAINRAVDPLAISPSAGFTGIAAYHLQASPASTAFTLSNGSLSAISWSLVNTSSWLNVSSAAGALAGGATASATVSLNTSVATNLAPGVYSASVVFSNRTTGVTLARAFTLNTAIANWPIALTGFNAAILASNNATAAAPGATAFDVPNNYCFYQSGLGGGARGLPAGGVLTSKWDATTAFHLGAYGVADALMLGGTYPASGALTLATPQAYNSLTILAASANGSSSSQGGFVIHFANGAQSSALNFNAQDWFNITSNVAIQGFGRLKLGASFGAEDNGDSNPNLYQTTVNLAALGLTQPISSITFNGPASGGRQTTAVFAMSGMPSSVPINAPQNLIAIPGANGTIQLVWGSSAGAVGYEIYRSLISGGSYAGIGSASGTSFTDANLLVGVTYYYVVSAVGVSNISDSVEVSAVPGSYESSVLPDNPMGYWRLDETAGVTAHDLISGNNGIYTPTVSLGQPGNSQLDSARAAGFGYLAANNSCVTNIAVNFAAASNATFSIEAWVNGGAQTTDAGIVTKGYGGGGEQFNLDCGGGGHAFRFFVRDSSGGAHLATSSFVPDNRWHHLVGICDEPGGYVYLYIDGTNAGQATVSASAGVLNSASNMSIGSRQSGSGSAYDNQFLGRIEKVAIYNYALNASQILAHYQTATHYLADVPKIISPMPGKFAVEWLQGALLQTTNLAGPWTTNPAVSPYWIQTTNSQMYFRVRLN